MTTADVKAREKQLWANYRQDPSVANRQRLEENYYSVLQKLAALLISKDTIHVPIDELISYGYDGLRQAIDAYDPNRRVPFLSYASLRIRGAMIDGFRRSNPERRVIRGEDAPRRKLHSLESLDERIYLARLNELFATDDVHARNIDELDALQHLLNEVGVSARERVVFVHYYADGLTLTEIAERLGMSLGAMSHIHHRVLLRFAAYFQVDPKSVKMIQFNRAKETKPPPIKRRKKVAPGV